MIHIAWGLVIASGKEEQMSAGADTAFLNLGGKPVFSYALKAFEECSEIDGVAVVAPKERMGEVRRMVQMFGYTKVRKIVAGKAQRQTSLQAGLKVLDDDVSIVVIHEGSRPCVWPDLIGETVKAAKRYGCGIAAMKVEGALKIVPKGQKVSKTLDPHTAWISQTPLAFKLDVLQRGLASAAKKNLKLQDEAVALEQLHKDVHVVPSNSQNFKIRNAEDLALAEALMRLQDQS